MILDPHQKQNSKVPKEYNIRTTDEHSQNTFVFSEKDLPGYSSRNRGGAGQGGDKGIAQGKVDKTKRFQPFYRKAVPSMSCTSSELR